MEKTKREKMSTIDRVLLGIVFFLLGFIISMIVIFCIYQATPDVLIECVLTACTTEAVISFAIWWLKRKQSKEDKKREVKKT